MNAVCIQICLLLTIIGAALSSERSGCGGPRDLYGSGTFYSHPGFDGTSEYSKSSCTWILHGSNNGRVELNFEAFDLEGEELCPYDFVRVYDGREERSLQIGKYCKTNIPPIIQSKGNVLIVKFKADHSVMKSGFKAVFKTIGVSDDASKSQCGPEAFREKVLNVGIFYTSGVSRKWKEMYPDAANKGKLAAMSTLMDQMNNIFSTFGRGNSVTFNIEEKNIQIFGERELASILRDGNEITPLTNRFCKVAHSIRERMGLTWNVAMLFVDSSEYTPPGEASGSTAGQGTICSVKDQRNCALLMVDGSQKSADTMLMLDRLVAHEIGHLFNLNHDPCSVNPDCLSSLMWSPGSKDAKWSQYTKNEMNKYFSNPRTDRCLKYRCGGQYVSNGTYLLDSEANRKVLDDVCDTENSDAKYKVDNERESLSWIHNSENTGSFYTIWRENTEWYKIQNVCRGIPCLADLPNNRMRMGGVRYMDGKPCAVGKKCHGQVCQ